MSHITALSIDNVKRIIAVRITPTGPLTVVGGMNEQGKSSVLDSIAMALGGKDYVPAVPIHRGADSGEIVITLDSGIVVKRTFTAGGGTYLKVTSADGAVFQSPQAMLDELTGKLTFDPLAFLRLESAKQAAALRKLVGLDFTVQDAKRKKLFEDRAVVNKRLAEMRASVATLPHYPDAPTAEVSSADILAQIEDAQAHNAGLTPLTAAANAANLALSQSNGLINQTNAAIASLEKQLAVQRAELVKHTVARDKAQAAMTATQDAEAAFELIDTTDLKTQLAACEQTNAKVRANAQRTAAITEGTAKKAAADALTRQIEALDQAKVDALAAAQFPVDGLSFADDVVTYQGLPFTEASSARQQRVSVAIGAALNPKLRVMLIRDGSLLDPKSLEALREAAEELDLQLWIERVSEGAECSVIIENGEVRGAEPIVSAATALQPKKRTATKPAPTVDETVVPAGALF